jgi:hypothetical protein
MKGGSFMGKIDWDVVTNFTDAVTTTLKTVTFPKVQEQVYLRNQGNANFTYTIGSQSGTLTPGQSVTVNQDVSSFTLQAVSGTHTFEVRAKEKGTEINETDNNLPSNIAEQLNTLSSSMADRAKQADLDTQKSRIDNLVTNAGNTSGNSEIIDIRVGADGVTYTSAGEAVRAIGKHITLPDNYNRLTDHSYNAGGWWGSNGEIVNNTLAVNIFTQYIPLAEGESAYVSGTGVNYIQSFKAYDKNKVLLPNGAKLETDQHVITGLTGCAYVRIAVVNTVVMDSVVVQKGTTATPIGSPVLKNLSLGEDTKQEFAKNLAIPPDFRTIEPNPFLTNPYIYNKKVYANQEGFGCAKYIGVDMVTPPKKVSAKIAFLPGTIDGTATLITNPTGITSNGQIGPASVHVTYGNGVTSIGIFQNNVLTALVSHGYSNIVTDGKTEYYIDFSVSGNTVTATCPDGVVITATDTRVPSSHGKYVTWEHYWQDPMACRPLFSYFEVTDTNNVVVLRDDFNRANGELTTAPTGQVYSLY